MWNSGSNSYEVGITRRIDSFWPGISDGLDQLAVIDGEIACRILGVLLEFACQATHATPIVFSRRAIGRIPPEWLRENLFRVASERLNWDDEWEYRRLLELVDEVSPALLPQFIERGLVSSNEEVREAVQEYRSK